MSPSSPRSRKNRSETVPVPCVVLPSWILPHVRVGHFGVYFLVIGHMSEHKVWIRLKIGHNGLVRGTDLHMPQGIATDLIERGIAGLLPKGYASPITGMLNDYARK